MFLQNQTNCLILDRLKEIKQLQNDIELNELYYETKNRNDNSSKTSLPTIFLRNTHTIEDAD